MIFYRIPGALGLFGSAGLLGATIYSAFTTTWLPEDLAAILLLFAINLAYAATTAIPQLRLPSS